MNITARFNSKAPQEIDNVERLTITVGEFEIEIVSYPDVAKKAVLVRLDGPLGRVDRGVPARVEHGDPRRQASVNGCPYTVGGVPCGRPTTHCCANAPDTCERHKSSCCTPIVDKARIAASFLASRQTGRIMEIARPTYVDLDERGVLRPHYVRCPDCRGIQRSLKASPQRGNADECGCPLFDLSDLGGES